MLPLASGYLFFFFEHLASGYFIVNKYTKYKTD